MDSSIRSTLLRTIDIVLRRRYLLLVPLLVMLPVSIAFAAFMGGGYSARSLVMLQETVASNPLAHDVGEPNLDRMAQMLKGLRALLASDYVLAPIVDDGSGEAIDTVTRASRVRELSKNVSVDLLGNDFLEFRLAGSAPAGLGDKLQSIMTNLIGALVAPPGENAGLFALHSLQEKLASADRQSAALDSRIADLLPVGLDTAKTQLAALKRRQAELADRVSLLDQEIAKAFKAAPDPGRNAGWSALTDERTAIQKQAADLVGSIDGLSGRIAAFEQAQADKAALAKSTAAIRARVDAEKSRFGGDSAATWGAMINAPERMIVVDPPQDPKLRTSSRLYFVVSGAFGGLLLGVALVILAEIFDTTLRNADQMTVIAGVPCLGSLPALAAASGAASYPLGLPIAGLSRLSRPASRLADRRSVRDD